MAIECEMWEGPEAEGTFKGIRTLFIRSGALSNIMAYVKEYPHIFFTKEFKVWDTIRAALSLTSCLVTVELWDNDVDKVPWDIITRAHLLIRISAPWIHKLKGTDNIILGSDYDGYTYIRDGGVRSIPSDYQLDREVR